MKTRALSLLLTLLFLAPAFAARTAPVAVTASDIVSKVFGFLPEGCSLHDTVEESCRQMNFPPDVDETGIWLDSECGYALSYSGMMPPVAAVAQFDGEKLQNYGYFFFFPYDPGCREAANLEQCAFCGALLQEMHDLGLMVDLPADQEEDALFEAIGYTGTSHLNVMLKEKPMPAGGTFMLIVAVTPDHTSGYTVLDPLATAD